MQITEPKEMLRSAHPVEPHMRAQVLDALRDIEARHDVTVLFACESGSRGWGFASPDSDYDVRFIYVNRLPWYLTVAPGRDVIEVPISGDLDINGWDLRKALGLLRESNPTLLEWLGSPIVYREEAETMAQFRTLAAQVFSNAKGWHHYASMAKKNFREHLLAQHTLHPVHDAALVDEINALLEVKMRAGEAATSPRWPGIHAFIEAELARNAAEPVQPLPVPGYAALDTLLHDTVLRYQR